MAALTEWSTDERAGMQSLEKEVLRHLVALLKIDTSNPGPQEAAAAAYVSEILEGLGAVPEMLEPEPGRCSVVARWPGRDPSLPALVVHGHLDVVPADPAGWTRDPFGGEIADGLVWGRGAVDMKATVAMVLAVLGAFARGSHAPRRELVLAFFADEEMGSRLGSGWAVENRPELFAGATEAIGEIGGFTMTLPGGRRVYPLQIAERGMLWGRITVEGPGGHAAFSSVSNPVERIAKLVERVQNLGVPTPVEDLQAMAQRLGVTNGNGAKDREEALAALGPLGTLVAKAGATTFVPTVLEAGSKLNVIPDSASLGVDCRFLPGDDEKTLTALRSAMDPDMSLEILSRTPGACAPGTGPIVDACSAAIHAADPTGTIVPYTLPASTDGQHLARLGIAPYGFAPLILSSDLDLLSLFHARDERVPVSAVEEGCRVLLDFLTSY
ncbi:MAG: M20/M25/M40 family metallo-hydrolase [Solirubrobacterales bacterium]